MSFLTYVGIGAIAIVALFVGTQFLLVSRMRRQRGKHAPELDGKAQRWLKKGKPALFYFYSPSCGACRAMTPVVKTLEKERGGVFPVDISRDMETARKFGVMATPTTVVVDNGIIREVLIGPQPRTTLEAFVSA